MRDEILVVGAGKSGVSAVSLLSLNKEKPVLFDSNTRLNIEEVREKLLPCAKEIPIFCGELPDAVADRIGGLVLSPGVPLDSDFVKNLSSKGIRVSGEIELAYSYEKGTLIAITGTNGKTTTTALVGKIINDYMGRALVVGNIGTPYTGEVTKSNENTVTVAEISSFQLETADRFKPHIAAILNITPDHLNRHHTMEQYIIEKKKIAARQDGGDFLILNYDDRVLRDYGRTVLPRVIYFSSHEKLKDGFYYEDGFICMNMDGEDKKLLNKSEMNIIGLHNMENAMAGMAMAYAYGVPLESIVNSVKEFKAVEHRIEFVRELNGVRYYDDSKGTNVDAAIKGIQAMDRPACLIGGGYDKGAEYDDWINAFDGRVKKLVLIGQTAEKIAECAKKNGFTDYVFAGSMEEAVKLCRDNAKNGDAVLLSPACASWGMFDNFEQRGDIFKELVNCME
ncbi:MAG: UDP-N-acetylmuramoyl-L-alanine--D-glutamate ligase [Lachnospiraceae bacterium]|nr:UDP-N-acetylmuramoyl-L-alanine--D-glutamate ligase [Lachnospiraceae bacterium]